jgi:hypothetical protein
MLFRGGTASRRFLSSCGRLLGSNTTPLRFAAWRFDEGAAVGIGFGPAAFMSLIACGRSLVEKITPCRSLDWDEVVGGTRSVGIFGGGFTFAVQGRVISVEGAPMGQTGEYILLMIRTLTWTAEDWNNSREGLEDNVRKGEDQTGKKWSIFALGD